MGNRLSAWAKRVNAAIYKTCGLRLTRSPSAPGQPVTGHANLGEEQVLQEVLALLPDVPKSYVDIGASDGVSMSNTWHLAAAGWQGTCFEYDPAKAAAMTTAYQRYSQVSISRAKVTPMNVNLFLNAYGIERTFGLLSLDIDSYDFFILQALLGGYRPYVILAEINEKIPPPLEFTVLYSPSHSWDTSHFYGMSICQLDKLCRQHEYVFAALEYNNAFLAPKEVYRGKPMSAEEAYRRGYAARPDRRQKFPWNADMECLLTMDSASAKERLMQLFSKYEGKFHLSGGTPERGPADRP